MNYQSGDKLTNRYLSNDAFTSLKNKLGGRSITSLGSRRKNSYKVANQGFGLFEYKSLIYRLFIIIILLSICVYVIPQTRYFVHGLVSKKINSINKNTINADEIVDDVSTYNVAPAFLKTDQFTAKQKENPINSGVYVYDLFTKNPIGVTVDNSSSTINIKLFSDSGFKDNFLIEQDKIIIPSDVVATSPNTVDLNSTSSNSTSTNIVTETVKESNKIYQSFVFEGLGYGQLISKVPPDTEVKKDTFIYIRTVDGLKPIAQIINVDKDNKSTFTIIHAQLIISPQNIYKVIIKN